MWLPQQQTWRLWVRLLPRMTLVLLRMVLVGKQQHSIKAPQLVMVINNGMAHRDSQTLAMVLSRSCSMCARLSSMVASRCSLMHTLVGQHRGIWVATTKGGIPLPFTLVVLLLSPQALFILVHILLGQHRGISAAAKDGMHPRTTLCVLLVTLQASRCALAQSAVGQHMSTLVGIMGSSTTLIQSGGMNSRRGITNTKPASGLKKVGMFSKEGGSIGGKTQGVISGSGRASFERGQGEICTSGKAMVGRAASEIGQGESRMSGTAMVGRATSEIGQGEIRMIGKAMVSNGNNILTGTMRGVILKGARNNVSSLHNEQALLLGYQGVLQLVVLDVQGRVRRHPCACRRLRRCRCPRRCRHLRSCPRLMLRPRRPSRRTSLLSLSMTVSCGGSLSRRNALFLSLRVDTVLIHRSLRWKKRRQ